MRLRPDEVSAECAVHFIEPGADVAGGVEAEAGHGAGGFVGDLFVFLGFEGAGGIDEGAAGFQQCGAAADEGELLGGESHGVFLGEPPADVHAAADDAGVAARGINEDAVEAARGQFGGVFHGVEFERLGVAGAEAFAVGAEAGDAAFP